MINSLSENMKSNIIVATKGRPKETFQLLSYLSRQTYPTDSIVIVGHVAEDIAGLESHPLTQSGVATLHLSPMGSCHQRNTGLEVLAKALEDTPDHEWMVVFFDDDFRPAVDWIEKCVASFLKDRNLIGITGYVVADGVTNGGYDEQQVTRYLNKEVVAENTAEPEHAVTSLYGCNMAFLGSYASKARFDENLPLYGWLEDVDYSYQALKYGKLQYIPDCTGVHMGVSSGRTSGVRFGYSQIANPTFLIAKGTMPTQHALIQLSKNFLANVFNTLLSKKKYRQRLYGNFCAIKDIALFRCKPSNILDIKQ